MAITYLAGNRWTGTTSDRTGITTGNITAGLTFLETNTDDLYFWDGDSWNIIAGDSIAQTLVNKTLTAPQINDTSANHQYVFTVNELSQDRNVILPALGAHDTFTFNNHTATFENKTIVHGADGNSVTGLVNASIAGGAAIAMSKTALVAGTGITLATNTLNVDAAQTQITSVGALDAGSITSNFGTINTGSSNITTTGTISAGNLTVTGTTTTVNSTVMTVVDPIIHLQTASGGGDLSSDTNKDVGLMMEYHNGSAAKQAFLGWDDSASKLTFVPDATLSSEVVSGSVGTIVANLEGDVTGDVTGSSGSTTGNAATVTNGVYLTGAQTLQDKILTAPKFADGGFIADSAGLEMVIFDSVSSAVNEVTIANAATGAPASITASGETNIGLKLSGKGTEGVILANATLNGAFLEFANKITDAAQPADCGADEARMYLKQIDSNNNAIEVKIKKAGAIQKVQITSPKAVCGECGSKDGASDPTYDFSRNVMILDLWCGHTYEVPMHWSAVNGNS